MEKREIQNTWNTKQKLKNYYHETWNKIGEEKGHSFLKHETLLNNTNKRKTRNMKQVEALKRNCVTQDDDTWNMKLIGYIASFSKWSPAICCGVEVEEKVEWGWENWLRVQAPPILFSGSLLSTGNLKPATWNAQLEIWNGANRNTWNMKRLANIASFFN